MSFTSSHSIGIAGAGLFGRLLALTLRKRGHAVTLFDSGESSAAASAAGLLSPYSELLQAEPLIAEMGLQSIQLWPAILSALSQPVYFQQAGSLVVTHSVDGGESSRLQHCLQRHPQLSASWEMWSEKQLAEKEPGLAERFSEALYLPEEGQISSLELLDAFAEALNACDVKWHTECRVDVTPYQIISPDKTYTFDAVFDCRGLGAKKSMPALRGVRGELMWLQTQEIHLNRPVRLLHPRYPLYVAPRPDGLFLVGATQIESEDFSPISVQSSLELLSAAYSIHPAFAEARVIKTVAQCRPALPDNLPRIEHAPGLIAINGLYRHGFLLAPFLLQETLALFDEGSQGVQYPQLLQAHS